MGGYGALKLALRCPERFAGAVALSPVTDPRSWFANGERPGMREELTRIFGSEERIVANGDDLFTLADDLLGSGKPKPRILQICGTEDGLLQENHRFRLTRSLQGSGDVSGGPPGKSPWQDGHLPP